MREGKAVVGWMKVGEAWVGGWGGLGTGGWVGGWTGGGVGVGVMGVLGWVGRGWVGVRQVCNRPRQLVGCVVSHAAVCPRFVC